MFTIYRCHQFYCFVCVGSTFYYCIMKPETTVWPFADITLRLLGNRQIITSTFVMSGQSINFKKIFS